MEKLHEWVLQKGDYRFFDILKITQDEEKINELEIQYKKYNNQDMKNKMSGYGNPRKEWVIEFREYLCKLHKSHGWENCKKDESMESK